MSLKQMSGSMVPIVMWMHGCIEPSIIGPQHKTLADVKAPPHVISTMLCMCQCILDAEIVQKESVNAMWISGDRCGRKTVDIDDVIVTKCCDMLFA